MPPLYNQIEFKRLLNRKMESYEGFARSAANTRFVMARQELLEEFDEHPVTQEIEAGQKSPLGTDNLSDSLQGKGNLYTFLGFLQPRNPVQEVRTILKEEIKMGPKAQITHLPKKSIFSFPVLFPTMEDLEARTPMDWESGKSWLRAVERGVTGFGAYIYWKIAGRSTGGLEAKDGKGKLRVLRQGKYRPVSYMSALLRKFKEKFL